MEPPPGDLGNTVIGILEPPELNRFGKYGVMMSTDPGKGRFVRGQATQIKHPW